MRSLTWLRVDWRLTFYGVVIALAVFIPLLLTPWFDGAELFFLFVGVPVTLLVLLMIAALTRSLSVFVMAIAIAMTSYFVGVHSNQIRFTGRWLLWGKEYRAAVNAQKTAEGGLPHIEWDGWGFAGSDTVVYVVYDANDALASVANRHLYGRVSGIPCGVSNIYRLEKHWYSVVMYTDTGWNDCPG